LTKSVSFDQTAAQTTLKFELAISLTDGFQKLPAFCILFIKTVLVTYNVGSGIVKKPCL